MAKTLVLTMVLAYGSAAHAQPAPRADPAGQLALVEAQFTAWRAAVTELLDHSDVKALRLKPVEVEAYTAVLVETTDPRPRLDLAETARRMAACGRIKTRPTTSPTRGPACSDSTSSWRLLLHESARK